MRIFIAVAVCFFWIIGTSSFATTTKNVASKNKTPKRMIASDDNTLEGKWLLESHGCRQADNTVRSFVPYNETIEYADEEGTSTSVQDGCTIISDFSFSQTKHLLKATPTKLNMVPEGCLKVPPFTYTPKTWDYVIENDKLTLTSVNNKLIPDCAKYFITYLRI